MVCIRYIRNGFYVQRMVEESFDDRSKRDKARIKLRRPTSNANEFPRALSDQLLLIQTRPTTFYAIQIVVYLVGTVECNVKKCASWKGVKLFGIESRAFYHFSRLVASRYEVYGFDLRIVECFDGFNDIDNSAP